MKHHPLNVGRQFLEALPQHQGPQGVAGIGAPEGGGEAVAFCPGFGSPRLLVKSMSARLGPVMIG